MSLPEGFTHKYLVLKWDDIEMSFSARHHAELDGLLERVEEAREVQGKPRTNDYIVVNTDEPYINEIIEILKKNGHWG